MALKMAVEKLDEIPEAQRGLYTKDGDVFRLDLEGYEDPTTLKSALEKERKAARDAVGMTKAWKDLGKTPEEIAALVAAHEQAEKDKLKKAGEWDKLRHQMDEQHQQALAKEAEKANAYRSKLERTLVDAAGARALAEAKGNTELLLPHLKARVKVIEENGELEVRVVDAQGNPRVNAKGEFLSIPDVVSEMRQSDTFAPGFLAPNASGGGARPSGAAGSKTMSRSQFEQLAPAQRGEVARSGVAIVD